VKALLARRGLRPLLAAEVVSALGSQMTFLALPWFVLVTTGSAARMSIVLGVQLLPTPLLGIASGSLIARLGARQTMVIGDAARAPLLASIPLLHAAGWLSFGVLLVLVFLIGLFLAPYFSAQRLILPELVGDDEATVAQANAFVEGAQRLTGMVGPSTAGVLISLFGAEKVLYIDAATFVFSFLMLSLFVPRKPPVPASEESRGLFAGIRYLWRDPLLRTLGVTALFLNMFGQVLAVSLPVLAYEHFDGSSRVAGAFFAAFGGGAIVGTLIAVRVVSRFDPVRLGAFSLVAMTIPIWLLPLPVPAAVVVVALALSAVFGPLVNAPLISMITMRAPDALRPKVMTAILTVALLAGPAGLVAAGPLLEAWGPRPIMLVVAAGELLAAIPFAALAFRRRGPESVPVVAEY
jgi:MFS family permease